MKVQFADSNVHVFESALYRTTSTVLQTPDLILVVDPNWLPEEVNTIRNYVNEIRSERPLYMLFTHSDYDHIIGYDAFHDAKVIASQAFVENTDKEKIIQQIKDWDAQYYISRNYRILYPKVDIIIEKEEQTLEFGGTKLLFFLAPGHTGDGLFTILEHNLQKYWIAGDYLSNIEFPFIYHSSNDYLVTIAKAEHIMMQISPKLLIPGHGDTTVDDKDMMQRINDSKGYIIKLRQTIESGEVFDEASLWQRYPFKKGMESYHQDNIALIKKELEFQS
ncbi:MAG: MBL fold metallo-hydrolase [Saprospiraceae bacterium]|nr:MBL fold metallo-hydrolase [Saprospiraceae bacterium]